MNEQGRLELLRQVLADGAPAANSVALGIGDDAAVIELGAARLAWSVDALVEGVHFVRGWLSLSDLGYKATMAALSDLAAMGARPLAVTSALVLPAALSDAELEALARGQREACQAAGTLVVGGNLARGGELSITTGVLGALEGATLTRAGAEPGDALFLCGPVGLAGAGLRALASGAAAAAATGEGGALEPALTAWRRPVARTEAGLRAAAVAHAAIDVSDGLALDAARMATAGGVKLVLRADAVITPALERAALCLGSSALDLALSGGEDYALLTSAPAELAPDGFVPIGVVEPLAAGEAPLWLELQGQKQPLEPVGFDHFAAARIEPR